MGVVSCINTLTCTSLPELSLLRHLALHCLELNIWFQAKHMPGVENKVAGALSLAGIPGAVTGSGPGGPALHVASMGFGDPRVMSLVGASVALVTW